MKKTVCGGDDENFIFAEVILDTQAELLCTQLDIDWNSEEIKLGSHYVIEIFKATRLDEMSKEVSKKRRQLRLD